MGEKELVEKIVYFWEKGPQNTSRVLELAKEVAQRRGIKSIIVATTQGETGVKAAKIFKGFNLIVVTHSFGFAQTNVQELTERNKKIIEKEGAKIITSIHAFGGIGRAVRKKFKTYELDDIIASTLRIFGEGIKVAVEITLMAADAGLVKAGEEVIAVAGTGRGADAAAIIEAANTQSFFDLKVKEIICKPRL